MSIRINKDLCQRCGKCIDICPGNLISADDDNRAVIESPKDCWGCAACIKECSSSAIEYYLAEDLGGKGSYLRIKHHEDKLEFIFVKGKKRRIVTINRKQAKGY